MFHYVMGKPVLWVEVTNPNTNPEFNIEWVRAFSPNVKGGSIEMKRPPYEYKAPDEWIAELDVPADQVRHLLNGEFRVRDDIEVSLVVASAPDVVLPGEILEMARIATTPDEQRLSNVKLTVAFEAEDAIFRNVRPGTTVFANITCDRVSLAYSLFHRVLLTLRFRFF